MQLLPTVSSPDGLISARYALITKTPGWEVLTTTRGAGGGAVLKGGGEKNLCNANRNARSRGPSLLQMDPKVCIPEMAQPEFPCCKFRVFPQWSLRSGEGGGGGGAPPTVVTIMGPSRLAGSLRTPKRLRRLGGWGGGHQKDIFSWEGWKSMAI